MPASSSRVRWGIASGVAAIIVITLALVAYLTYGRARPSSPATAQGNTAFLLHANSASSWWNYAAPDTVQRITAPASFVKATGVTPIEEARVLSSGDVPALVRAGPSPTVAAFGLIGPNGAFRSLTNDPFPKEGLTTNASGSQVAYAVLEPSGQPPHFSAAWHIKLYDFSATTMPAAVDLGEGFEPRFLQNGDILAMSPAGMVEIQPTAKKQIVLSRTAVLWPGMYAASADGSYVATAATATSTAVYALDATTTPATLARIGTIDYFAYPVAFLQNGQLIAERPGANALIDLTLYGVSQSGITPLAHIASSSPLFP